MLFRYAETAAERGIRVIIAGAGGAAHLPGMLAAKTTLPVIGVPVPTRAPRRPRLAAVDRPDAARHPGRDRRHRQRRERRAARGRDPGARRPGARGSRSRRGADAQTEAVLDATRSQRGAAPGLPAGGRRTLAADGRRALGAGHAGAATGSRCGPPAGAHPAAEPPGPAAAERSRDGADPAPEALHPPLACSRSSPARSRSPPSRPAPARAARWSSCASSSRRRSSSSRPPTRPLRIWRAPGHGCRSTAARACSAWRGSSWPRVPRLIVVATLRARGLTVERRLTDDELDLPRGVGPRARRPLDRHRRPAAGRRAGSPRCSATARAAAHALALAPLPGGEPRAARVPELRLHRLRQPAPRRDDDPGHRRRRGRSCSGAGIEPGRGWWAQPGGFLEVDETVTEAAVRETLEETGLLVRAGRDRRALLAARGGRGRGRVRGAHRSAAKSGRRPRPSRCGRSRRKRSRGARSPSRPRSSRSATGSGCGAPATVVPADFREP